MTSVIEGGSKLPRRFSAKKSERNVKRPSITHPSTHLDNYPVILSIPVKMVKLTEVEDEHFSEKPTTTKGALLVSDDEDDYSDTG